MKQVLTIVVKLQPTPEQVTKLEATLQAFTAACNYVNKHTDPKLTNKIAIQALTYQTIKSEFNLVANMAVRACARVAANRKVAKHKGKPVKKFAPTSIDCDKDLFRFREHDWTVSLATVHGRERVELSASIAIEDLTGIRERTNEQPRNKTERRLSNSWAFYQLRLFIEYKARSTGVMVIPISPAYTSQMCHQCLHIHPVKGKSYRSGKTFKCGHCGWHRDADFNGANNIALVGLSINQPGGTGLSCRLNRTLKYVQLNLFDDFRATENPDLLSLRSG